jgi:DNA primase
MAGGRGGDVIRFAELYHQVKFGQALALLRQWRGAEPLLHQAARFYAIQLERHPEAVAYLLQRGVRSPQLIEHMQIGYAPGGCLRGWLTQLGYPLPTLRQAGLVTSTGYDAYVHRVVFPLEGNLYGRSLSASAPASSAAAPRLRAARSRRAPTISVPADISRLATDTAVRTPD